VPDLVLDPCSRALADEPCAPGTIAGRAFSPYPSLLLSSDSSRAWRSHSLRPLESVQSTWAPRRQHPQNPGRLPTAVLPPRRDAHLTRDVPLTSRRRASTVDDGSDSCAKPPRAPEPAQLAARRPAAQVGCRHAAAGRRQARGVTRTRMIMSASAGRHHDRIRH